MELLLFLSRSCGGGGERAKLAKREGVKGEEGKVVNGFTEEREGSRSANLVVDRAPRLRSLARESFDFDF